MICCVSPRDAKVNVATDYGEKRRKNQRNDYGRWKGNVAVRKRADEWNKTSNDTPQKHQRADASRETEEAINDTRENSDCADEEAHGV
jgi:hypothetical protein